MATIFKFSDVIVLQANANKKAWSFGSTAQNLRKYYGLMYGFVLVHPNNDANKDQNPSAEMQVEIIDVFNKKRVARHTIEAGAGIQWNRLRDGDDRRMGAVFYYPGVNAFSPVWMSAPPADRMSSSSIQSKLANTYFWPLFVLASCTFFNLSPFAIELEYHFVIIRW